MQRSISALSPGSECRFDWSHRGRNRLSGRLHDRLQWKPNRHLTVDSGDIRRSFSADSDDTPTPTNTPVNTPTNTPTATATTPGGQPAISVSVPTPAQLVDPIAGFTVTGNTANLPVGATVLVRLRNANGETLGEQGIVPVANQAWTVTLKKTISSIATTSNGNMFAFLILNGNVIAQTNAIPLTFSGGNQQATLTITVPGNSTVDQHQRARRRLRDIDRAGDRNDDSGAGLRQQRPDAGRAGRRSNQQRGNWSATLNFNLAVNPGAGGYISASAIVNGNPVAVSNIVNVIWGSGTVKPFVHINSPTQGAIVGVNGAPVQVYGIAVNVHRTMSRCARSIRSATCWRSSRPSPMIKATGRR